MRNVLLVLVLLVLCQSVFAGVVLSPESLELSLFGCETVSETIFVSGDFLVPAGVVLEAVVFSESGDSNGFVVSFDKNAFVLLPGVPVEVEVSFFAVSNILPEEYSVELNAIVSVDVPVPVKPTPVVNRGSSGGGGGWMAPRPVVDENLFDDNTVVILPKKVRPPAPCVGEGQEFWHRECCEGLIKRPTTLTCEHPDVLLPGKLIELEPEPDWTGLWYWFGGFIIIALFVLGVYAHKQKDKKTLEVFKI